MPKTAIPLRHRARVYVFLPQLYAVVDSLPAIKPLDCRYSNIHMATAPWHSFDYCACSTWWKWTIAFSLGPECLRARWRGDCPTWIFDKFNFTQTSPVVMKIIHSAYSVTFLCAHVSRCFLLIINNFKETGICPVGKTLYFEASFLHNNNKLMLDTFAMSWVVTCFVLKGGVTVLFSAA